MFIKLLKVSLKNPIALWIAIAAMSCAMLISAALYGNYSNDIAFMFPENSLSGNMFRILQKARLTQAVYLEIDSGTKGRITEYADRLDLAVKQMQKLENVKSATFRFAPGTTVLHEEILASVPLHSSPDILQKANPGKAVRNAVKMLSTPGAPISTLRNDPFGIAIEKLNLLSSFKELGGLNFNIEHNFITDPDAKYALILVQSNFPKPPGAKEIDSFFSSLRKSLTNHIPGASISIISPMAHHLDNELTIKHDILTVTITSIAVLLFLFLLIYKKAFDALWIPVLPLIATILVTGVMALCFNVLCLFILGICGGIAGLAVDQGIHVFSAFSGKERIKKLAGIAFPLTLSVLTSAMVFFLVSTSGITAYIQLGIFSGAALIVNLLLSMFLLPTLLKRRDESHFKSICWKPNKLKSSVIIILWLAAILTSAVKLTSLKWDFTISSLDGASQNTLNIEQCFQKRWRNEKSGIPAVAIGKSRNAAMDNAKRFIDDVKAHSNSHAHFYPGMLWPASDERKQNLTQWKSEKTGKTIEKLKEQLEKECLSTGLPATFFQPFFSTLKLALEKPEAIQMPTVFRTVEEQMLMHYDDCTVVTMLLPQQKEHDMKKLLNIIEKHPEIAIVDAQAFQTSVMKDIIPRIKRLLKWLLPILLISLCPLLKNPLQLIIAALPGVTALLCMAGMASIAEMPLNLISLFSAFMLTGLILDYGIFALHSLQHPEEKSISSSIMLSAITTMLTSGALLASDHPVMFHTGLIISTGIGISAATALVVIPAIACILPLLKRKTLFSMFIMAFLIFSTGCASLEPQFYPERKVQAAEANKEMYSFAANTLMPVKRAFHAKIEIFGHNIPLLLAINSNPSEKSFKASFTAPNGPCIAYFYIKDGKLNKTFVSEAVPSIAKSRIFSDIPGALHAIFNYNFKPQLFHDDIITPFIYNMDKSAKAVFDGTPLRMTKLYKGNFPVRKWQATFHDWTPKTNQYRHIVYKSFTGFYTLTLDAIPQP